MDEPRIESTEVGNRRISWRAVGSGVPLLLVNGYAATGADWDPGFVAALAERFEVLCPDNGGLGASDPLPDGWRVDAIAEDLRALLAATGVDRCPVVGWSMGGFAAQRLAEIAPESVAALALLATDPGGPVAIQADAASWERLVDHGGTPREQATRLISLLFPPDVAREVDREFGEVVAAARAELPPAALSAQEQAIDAWHREDRDEPLPAPPPTLVLHGAEDEVIPAGNAELLGERWRSDRVELLDGCGHGFMAQRAGEVADLLTAFFRG